MSDSAREAAERMTNGELLCAEMEGLCYPLDEPGWAVRHNALRSEILKRMSREELAKGAGEPPTPRCPKCGSKDLRLHHKKHGGFYVICYGHRTVPVKTVADFAQFFPATQPAPDDGSCTFCGSIPTTSVDLCRDCRENAKVPVPTQPASPTVTMGESIAIPLSRYNELISLEKDNSRANLMLFAADIEDTLFAIADIVGMKVRLDPAIIEAVRKLATAESEAVRLLREAFEAHKAMPLNLVMRIDRFLAEEGRNG